MMGYFLLFFLFIFSIKTFAQTDASVYQIQRNKVNRLLTERNTQFEQYQESLATHTGIFGSKTKHDMQQSINILSEIIKTDNNILRETKLLLEYKDFEKNQAQNQSNESKSHISASMQTIRKLRQENKRLKDDIVKNEKKQLKFINAFIGFVILIVAAAVFLFMSKK